MQLKDITPLSQRDSRWKNKLLGFNTDTQYTIGGYGCLITCLAMLKNDAVDAINIELKRISGFLEGTGYYIWEAISRIYPEIKEKSIWTPDRLTDKQVSEIRNALDNGCPVMFQIDMYPETAPTDMHYVLCVGYGEEDNDYIINDPWTGTQRPLSDYIRDKRRTARSLIEQYVIYKGTGHKPNESSLDELTGALEAKIEGLEKEVDELRESRNKWRTKCNEWEDRYEKEIKEKQDHIESLQKSQAEMNAQLMNVTNQYKQLQEDFKTYKEESTKLISEYKEDLEGCESMSLNLSTANESLLKDLNKAQEKIKKLQDDDPLNNYSRFRLLKYLLTGK